MKEDMRGQTYDSTENPEKRPQKNDRTLEEYQRLFRSYQRHSNSHLLARLIDFYARAYNCNSFEWLPAFEHELVFETIEVIESVLKNRGMRVNWTGFSWELEPIPTDIGMAQMEIPF